MVARVLHYLSILCCAFVAMSFLLFAHAQTSRASTHQANLIAPPGQSQPTQAPRHAEAEPRRFIDEVSGKLTAPFASIVPSDDAWVRHGIPALFALLLYGAGLGFLSRWAAGRSGAPAPAPGPAPGYR
jgi:hypothetical protein